MNVLLPSEDSQEISIVPRNYSALSNLTVILIEDGSGKKQTKEGVLGELDGNYVTITVAFDILISNSTYSMEVRDEGENVIYKGKIFCTRLSNKAQKATLNTGEYTQHTPNNLNQKYIIVDGGSTDETPSTDGNLPGGGTLVKCYDQAEMDALTSAFQVCDLYCVTVDGVTYDDWYVPARGEVEAFLNSYAKVTNTLFEGYGYDKIPEAVVTSDPFFQVDYRYLWTSTELTQKNAFMWQIPIYGSNVVNQEKDLPVEFADLPFIVRPFRFEPSTDTSIIWGDKFAGGVVASDYVRDGVEGKLIVSPTNPRSITNHLFWSDLGETLTGVTGVTNGEENSNIILALENA